MGYSLKTQHARLIRAHQRLREIYQSSIEDRKLLREKNKELSQELRAAKSELRGYENASFNTLGKLFTSVRYAINHLYDAGDIEAAEKLSVWLDEMSCNMQPIADVKEILDLLDEWASSAESDSDQSLIYMRTRTVISELRGIDI